MTRKIVFAALLLTAAACQTNQAAAAATTQQPPASEMAADTSKDTLLIDRHVWLMFPLYVKFWTGKIQKEELNVADFEKFSHKWPLLENTKKALVEAVQERLVDGSPVTITEGELETILDYSTGLPYVLGPAGLYESTVDSIDKKTFVHAFARYLARVSGVRQYFTKSPSGLKRFLARYHFSTQTKQEIFDETLRLYDKKQVMTLTRDEQENLEAGMEKARRMGW